jgi:alpha-L-fucosidase
MAQVGDLIQAARPIALDVARPTNQPWVRWLDTPEYLVALVDRAGDTTHDVHQDAVAAGEGEVRAASGTARVGGGNLRVSVEELADGPAAVLLAKR